MKPHELSLTGAAELIAQKALSPVELVNAVIDRILEMDGAVVAYSLRLFEEARKDAKRAEQKLMAGEPITSLHGIPIALKDLIDVEGLPTSASSRVQGGHIARSDAEVTASLRKAGAIIIGKTHTHEFAFGLTTPQTANPWNLEHTPGGSSGGSAAAVAYGGAVAAIGTDTGGSIRVPAALCGVVGLKPTRDSISLKGVYPLSASLDHVGPITRTVGDAGLMFDLLSSESGARAGAAGNDRARPDLAGVKLGVTANYFYERLDPEINSALQKLCTLLKDAGAELVEISIPETETIMPAQWGIMLAEAAFVHRENIRSKPHLYRDDVRILLETGCLLPAQDYLTAKRAQARLSEIWSALFTQVDALIVPSVPQIAARRNQETFTWPDETSETVVEAYVRLNAVANLTGIPALTVPAGLHSSGLPFGVQLMGPRHSEPLLFQLGEVVESADPIGKCRKSLPVSLPVIAQGIAAIP